MIRPVLASRRSMGGPLASVSAGSGLPAAWGAYHFKGAASQAASYLDLSGNGNDLPVGVAPTWNSTDGLIFNGVDQYMLTGFTPQTDQSQSMMIQITNGQVSGTGALGGGNGGTGRRNFSIVATAGGSWRAANGGETIGSVSIAAGNLAVAGNRAYLNGADAGISLSSWTAACVPVFLGCRNDAGTPVLFCSVRMQALYIFDIALTAPEVAAVHAVMAAI